jgi:hypothetical protein
MLTLITSWRWHLENCRIRQERADRSDQRVVGLNREIGLAHAVLGLRADPAGVCASHCGTDSFLRGDD